ncbi:hypothetical protein CR513_29795, partial [Mucuna pruriens]
MLIDVVHNCITSCGLSKSIDDNIGARGLTAYAMDSCLQECQNKTPNSSGPIDSSLGNRKDSSLRGLGRGLLGRLADSATSKRKGTTYLITASRTRFARMYTTRPTTRTKPKRTGVHPSQGPKHKPNDQRLETTVLVEPNRIFPISTKITASPESKQSEPHNLLKRKERLLIKSCQQTRGPTTPNRTRSSPITMKESARKMAAYIYEDKILVHYFQDSLMGTTLSWYVSLERGHIKTWRDLTEAFLK